MKSLFLAVSALALCASTAAFPQGAMFRGQRPQQQQPEQQQPQPQQEQRGGRQGRQAPAQETPQAAAPQPAPQAAAPEAQTQRGQRGQGGQRAQRGANGPTGAFQGGGARGNANQNAQAGRGDNRDGDLRNRGDRGRAANRVERNQRFGYTRDYRGARNFNYRGRNFSAVRAPSYRYPRGFSYRRWYPGAFLPLFFVADRYYIDYDWIGLPPPPYGTRWVRYGSDALLVDSYTGEVEDVIYNVFY